MSQPLPVGDTTEYFFICDKKYKYNFSITGVLSVKTDYCPNWFNRWMQRLCFGFRWEKLNG